MTQITKKFVPLKAQERIVELFISAIIKCNSRDITLSLMEDLLTNNEKTMLSKRFSVAFLLLEDYDFRSISKILKVSTATVNSVSIALKKNGEGIRNIIKKIKSDESMKNLFAEFGDAFLELLAGNNRSLKGRIVGESKRSRLKAF